MKMTYFIETKYNRTLTAKVKLLVAGGSEAKFRIQWLTAAK